MNAVQIGVQGLIQGQDGTEKYRTFHLPDYDVAVEHYRYVSAQRELSRLAEGIKGDDIYIMIKDLDGNGKSKLDSIYDAYPSEYGKVDHQLVAAKLHFPQLSFHRTVK